MYQQNVDAFRDAEQKKKEFAIKEQEALLQLQILNQKEGSLQRIQAEIELEKYRSELLIAQFKENSAQRLLAEKEAAQRILELNLVSYLLVLSTQNILVYLSNF